VSEKQNAVFFISDCPRFLEVIISTHRHGSKQKSYKLSGLNLIYFSTFQIVGSKISKFIGSGYAGSDEFVWKNNYFYAGKIKLFYRDAVLQRQTVVLNLGPRINTIEHENTADAE
jgi:hypothetical protein